MFVFIAKETVSGCNVMIDTIFHAGDDKFTERTKVIGRWKISVSLPQSRV